MTKVKNQGVVTLISDHLSHYISSPKLLVVFGTSWCKACEKIKPQLKDLSNEINVVIVDTEKHLRSNKFYPSKIKSYPTIAYYENGYFRNEIKSLTNIKQEINELN